MKTEELKALYEGYKHLEPKSVAGIFTAEGLVSKIPELIAEVESLQKEIEIKTQYLNQKDDEIRSLRKEVEKLKQEIRESTKQDIIDDLISKFRKQHKTIEHLRAVVRAGEELQEVAYWKPFDGTGKKFKERYENFKQVIAKAKERE